MPPLSAVRPSPNTSHEMPNRGDTVFQLTMSFCSAKVRAGTQVPAPTLCSGIDITNRSKRTPGLIVTLPNVHESCTYRPTFVPDSLWPLGVFTSRTDCGTPFETYCTMSPRVSNNSSE